LGWQQESPDQRAGPKSVGEASRDQSLHRPIRAHGAGRWPSGQRGKAHTKLHDQINPEVIEQTFYAGIAWEKSRAAAKDARIAEQETKHHARLEWLAEHGAVIECMLAAKQTADVPLWYVSESAPADGPHPDNADPRRLYGESEISIEAAIDNAMERQAAGKEPYYV